MDAGGCIRDAKLTFAFAWIFVLFNYIYADIGSIFMVMSRPELIARLQDGQFGSVALTQWVFLGGAVLMEICIAMIPLSWMLGHKANRRANIAAGSLFTLVILVILFGSGRVPPLNFYTFFEFVEIAATSWIVWRAWRWKSAAAA
jgi:hypothetical protein